MTNFFHHVLNVTRHLLLLYIFNCFSCSLLLTDFNENGTVDVDDMNILLDTLTKDSMEQHLKDDIISRVLPL